MTPAELDRIRQRAAELAATAPLSPATKSALKALLAPVRTAAGKTRRARRTAASDTHSARTAASEERRRAG